MLILNNLESLIFNKNTSDEYKSETNNLISNPKTSSFHEVLHQAVNDASRPDPENLQTYSAISRDITDRREMYTSNESFSKDVLIDRLKQDTKQSVNDLLAFNESFSSEPVKISSYASNLEKPKSTERIDEESFSKIESSDKPSLLKENLEEKSQISEKILSKDVSSEILLQAFTKIKKNELSKEDFDALKKAKLEIKVEKVSNGEGKVAKLEEHTPLNLTAVKETSSKDSKKLDAKAVSIEIVDLKPKQVKSELASNEKLVMETSNESSKTLSKEVKAEDTPKLALLSAKSKENSNSTQKINAEAKVDMPIASSASTSILFGKEELATSSLLSSEKGKSKKVTDSNSKEKAILENLKPTLRDVSGIEKEIRLTKETLVEVSGFDKSKWTITRREKDIEYANHERKKEAVSLLSEIVSKSSFSQTSSESDKSFSNPRYETNGFKTFSETLKTANADKSTSAGFDRENFSKSLNDLVNKARINIVENGKNSAQISLYPKDLGKMTLNIDVIREKVDGKILVESEFIKTRLLGDLSQLKTELKASGLDLQSISIEVRSEGSLAFDFANPSNEKETSKENAKKSSKSLAQNGILEEESGMDFTPKQNKMLDIKI